jgi:hypothetical protein
MLDWTTYKRAALAYSRLRPRQVKATITPTIGEREVDLPADALAIDWIDYGVEVSVQEAYTDETETLGWATTDEKIVLTPAPETDDAIEIMYSARHLPDEDTETFPTIPETHTHFVEDLELALTLEAEADTINQGPLRYALGQTEINREKAPAALIARARQLRQAVVEQLDEPYGVWR